MKRYRCIMVDPPWNIRTKKPTYEALHPGLNKYPQWENSITYPTMSLWEIATLPVPELAAENAWLWLWVTNGRVDKKHVCIEEGLRLMREWGFNFNASITWAKGSGIPCFAPYMYVTEICLFGYRGRLGVNDGIIKASQLQTLHTASRTRHSEKPITMYQDINRIFPGPRLDMFSRRRIEGWEQWGAEEQGMWDPWTRTFKPQTQDAE